MDVYGLLGNPVGHSLSPPMHEAAYEHLVRVMQETLDALAAERRFPVVG
jgi:shikimate 5-dehydrogenase